MKRYVRIFLFALVACLGFLPLLQAAFEWSWPWLSYRVLAAINLLGWAVFIAHTISRIDIYENICKTASSLGIESRFQSLETVLGSVIRELNRKNAAFSMNLLEQRIASKEELSRTLERITALSFKLFSAESAELALFDRASGLYHSAIVLGTPMRPSSQAMLSGAIEGGEVDARPDVLVQPLAFAGSVLGTLRVALKKNTAPRLVDQDIMRLLGLQGSLALINAQYTEELMKMKRSADDSLKVKTGFLANLSHEIRAPLGIMMNANELVLDGLCGPVNKDQIDTLRMVHKNGEHLLELVNDVLDYAKVEAGRLQPQRVDILLGELLRDVCNVVRTQADAKSHRLICKTEDEALAINCDRRHARQMLINLLSNAIKYTPDGGQIEVWVERMPRHKLRIHVKDSGVGIDASDKERVFSPFERLDNAYSRNQVGTGLGMSLTRKLAEVNGGAIDFTSSPGVGSDFWLAFPSIEIAKIIPESRENDTDSVRGRGEVVLIVEKDEGERGMMAKYLIHHGFRVITAGSKREAIDIFKSREVNLAVVDNSAADDSNDDVVRAIRESENGRSLPIIVVSSRGFVFDIEKYLKAGIDRCLIKPVKMAELKSICRQLLDGTFEGEIIDPFEKAMSQKEKPKKDKPEVIRTSVIRLEDIQQ